MDVRKQGDLKEEERKLKMQLKEVSQQCLKKLMIGSALVRMAETEMEKEKSIL